MKLLVKSLQIRLLYNFVTAQQTSQHNDISENSQKIIYSTISFILILFSGFCSGATQGLLSIDSITLEIKQKYGTVLEQKYSKSILPIIKEHHLLLSTLLIANTISNESLPIFLNRITPDWMALLISVILIVLIGEILPSALMTGKYQLQIAYRIIPIIKFLEAILFLICYPLSLLLDKVLGTKSKRYHLQYIRKLFEISGSNDIIGKEELKIIASIMEMRQITIQNKYIPLDQVCYIQADEPYCKRLINKLAIKGYSYIPIIEQNIAIGTFNVKDLLQFDQTLYGKYVIQLVYLKRPLMVDEYTTLLQLLKLFIQNKTSIAYVYNIEHTKLLGIITLSYIFDVIAAEQFIDQDTHGTIRDISFVI